MNAVRRKSKKSKEQLQKILKDKYAAKLSTKSIKVYKFNELGD